MVVPSRGLRLCRRRGDRRGKRHQRGQGRRHRFFLGSRKVSFFPFSPRGVLRPRLARRRRRRSRALYRLLRRLLAAVPRPQPGGPKVGALDDPLRAAVREDKEDMGLGQVAVPSSCSVLRRVRGVHQPVAGAGGACGAVDEREGDGGCRCRRGMRCLLSSFLLYEKINEEHLPFLTARFPLFEFFLSFSCIPFTLCTECARFSFFYIFVRVFTSVFEKRKRTKGCCDNKKRPTLLCCHSPPPGSARTAPAAAPRHGPAPPLLADLPLLLRPLPRLPRARGEDPRGEHRGPELEEAVKDGQEQQQKRRVVPRSDQQGRRRDVDRVVHRRGHSARLGQVAAAVEEGSGVRIEDRLRVLFQSQQREGGGDRGGEEPQEVASEGLGGRGVEEAGIEERGLIFVVVGGGGEKERVVSEREKEREGRG